MAMRSMALSLRSARKVCHLHTSLRHHQQCKVAFDICAWPLLTGIAEPNQLAELGQACTASSLPSIVMGRPWPSLSCPWKPELKAAGSMLEELGLDMLHDIMQLLDRVDLLRLGAASRTLSHLVHQLRSTVTAIKIPCGAPIKRTLNGSARLPCDERIPAWLLVLLTANLISLASPLWLLLAHHTVVAAAACCAAEGMVCLWPQATAAETSRRRCRPSPRQQPWMYRPAS